MRIVVFLMALLLCAGPAAAPALAQQKTVTVTVKVKDPAGQPLVGAKVSLKNADTKEAVGEGETGGDGSVKIKVPPGPIWIDVQSDSSIPQKEFTITDATKDKSVELVTHYDLVGELAAAKQAAADCDAAAYDRHVANVKAIIAEDDRKIAELEKKAKDFASQKDIPYPDIESAEAAQKATRKAIKAGLASVNAKAFYNLETYIDMLKNVEAAKGGRAYKQAKLDELPARPACKTGALAPKGCPDGSGGLLAGTLNSVLGTDFQAACDKPNRRRDTERPEHDRD